MGVETKTLFHKMADKDDGNCLAEIKSKVSDCQTKCKEKVEELKETVEETLEDAKEAYQEIKEQVTEVVEDTKEAAANIGGGSSSDGPGNSSVATTVNTSGTFKKEEQM